MQKRFAPLAVAFILATLLVQLLPAPVAAGAPLSKGSAEFTHEGFRVRDGEVPPTFSGYVRLERGIHRFRTHNLSDGSDSIIHLTDLRGNQIAANDDDRLTGGPESRLIVDVLQAGEYFVVVRSASQEAHGTADVSVDNEIRWEGVSFGGWHVDLDNIQAGEVIQTTHLPSLNSSPHHIYILSSNGVSFEHSIRSGGPKGAAVWNVDADIGDRQAVIVAPSYAQPQPVRLIRNDAAFGDLDNDGLGNQLEAELGTCSALEGIATGPDGNAFDCALAADPRDTDGDGIRDGWEVLGHQDSYLVQEEPRIVKHESFPLALWGANPRHKDMFVEVDFRMAMPDEEPQKLFANTARRFAGYYGDTSQPLTEEQSARHAQSLVNPDGLPGISVHFDSGLVPESEEEAALYGDWGGYTAVPPTQADDGSWTVANYQTAWKEHMSPLRVGLFRYLMIYPSGGGQNALNSYAANGPNNSPWVLAHEFGHSMGLGHSGPAHGTGDVDANCKPNYPSLMNYGFQSNPSVGFSDGYGIGELNNTALTEWNAVEPSNAGFLNTLETTFRYYVDRENGHVDWNRDGEFAPAGTTVRAYANYRPGGGGCEYTRLHWDKVPNAASIHSPAMEWLGDRLYVFYTSLGPASYAYSTDVGECSPAGMDPCATWTNGSVIQADASYGIDALRIRDRGLLVVTIDQRGQLWERRMNLTEAGTEQWGAPAMMEGMTRAASEPSLARLSECEAYLAYAGADDLLYTNRLPCGRPPSFEGEQLALDQDGNPIAIDPDASPAIAFAYLEWNGEVRGGIWGAFPAADGRLDLYYLNQETSRWEKTDLLEGRPGPLTGRPAMAWVQADASDPANGKFYLLYNEREAGKPLTESKRRIVRMMTSYTKVTTTVYGETVKEQSVGLSGPFDNVWLYAYGTDLLFEWGRDENLRAMHSLAMGGDNWGKLQFRPKADGIVDNTYKNYDDWAVFRVTLCKNLVNPGGLVADPVTCPDS